jgi:hypothetical protein
VAVAAAATEPLDLFDGGNLHESMGQADTRDLAQGRLYEAIGFPVRLRFRPPDGRWGGAKFETRGFRFVHLNHLRTGNVPNNGVGFITLEAGTARTASATRTIARLHSTPLIDAGPIKPAHVAGFAGHRFDATITGADPGNRGISLAPFGVNHHCGYCEDTMRHETRDVKFAGKGSLFRIFALDVRGRTVVIYIESMYADQPKYPPTKTFPTFLPYANKMLATLRFPR